MTGLENNVTVRYVQPEDRENWIRLWHKFIATYEKPKLPNGIEDTNFDRFIDPQVKMWSAIAFLKDDATGAEKAIGFTDFFIHPSTWQIDDKTYLNDLFVDDDFRVGGVGRKLMEFVYNEADNLGAPAVYWNTDHFNHRAQLLYTKVGYLTEKRIYRRKGY